MFNKVIIYTGLFTNTRTTTDQVITEESESNWSQLSDSHSNSTLPFEFHLLQIFVENDYKCFVFAIGRKSVRWRYDYRRSVLREERRQNCCGPVILAFDCILNDIYVGV